MIFVCDSSVGFESGLAIIFKSHVSVRYSVRCAPLIFNLHLFGSVPVTEGSTKKTNHIHNPDKGGEGGIKNRTQQTMKKEEAFRKLVQT